VLHEADSWVWQHDQTANDRKGGVFVFFSNRIGCLGSLAVSAVITLLIVAILRLV
jgi:hypothetical protein